MLIVIVMKLDKICVYYLPDQSNLFIKDSEIKFGLKIRDFMFNLVSWKIKKLD